MVKDSSKLQKDNQSDPSSLPQLERSPRMAQRQKCCADVFAATKERHFNCLQQMPRDDLLIKDIHNQTALHYAVRYENHDAVKYLCAAVPELRECSSLIGETPLLIAAGKGSMKSVELILKGSLRDTINMAMYRDVNGTSVLMAAVARGDNEMAFWFLKNFGKALGMLPNKAKMLPLHVAAAQGNIDFIRVATKYDKEMVNFRDEFGCTPCVYAVQGGCLTSVRYLVEKARSEMGSVSSRGQSLLHIACLSGHDQVVKWLLTRMGSDAALWTTNELANAVHCAAFSGSVPVLTILLSCWSKKKRAHVLALRDSRGNSPLHLTAINNHMDAALYLLDNGANPLLVNNAGHAPQAIARMRGHEQMAKTLANHTDLNGKVKGNKKESNKAKVHSELRQSGRQGSSLSSGGVASPIDYGYQSGHETGSRLASPRQMSSGYSSSGENGSETGFGAGTVERRPMRYVEEADGQSSSGSVPNRRDSHSHAQYAEVATDEAEKKDMAAQTDEDLLTDHIKVLDDRAWAGAGLAAVDEIDRVLEEVDTCNQ